MNNTIDLSKLPISPNEDIKNVVAINNDGDVIIAENYTQTDIDLSDYVTAEEINKELENYPTFTDLEDELQTYVEFPDLEDYVTDTELSTTLNNYVTDSELSGYNYIDESELADAVHNIEVQITPIVKVTQAEYDSMVKDENTLYIII